MGNPGIVETIGLGAFAMADSPSVVRYVGTSAARGPLACVTQAPDAFAAECDWAAARDEDRGGERQRRLSTWEKTSVRRKDGS